MGRFRQRIVRPMVIRPPSASSGANTVKWNPGEYLRFIPSGTGYWFYALQITAVRDLLMDFITDETPGVGAEGVWIDIAWASVETSYGVYDFTYLDEVADLCKSLGLRFGFVLQTGSQFVNTDGFPQYMLDDWTTYFHGRYGNPTGDDAVVRWWNATPQARLIALHDAIAAHYDGDAKFEFFSSLGESSIDFGAGTDTTYTYASALAGFEAIWEAWHVAAPRTTGCSAFNDFKDDTLETGAEYFAICQANHVGCTDPNSVHYAVSIAQVSVRGGDYDGNFDGSSAFTDWTTIIPMFAPGWDDNDVWTDPYGPAFGTPYQSWETQWEDKVGDHDGITPSFQFSGSGVHGAFDWNLPDPYTLLCLRPQRRIWLVNGPTGHERGGDSSNQWNTYQKSWLTAKVGTAPTYSAPSCFNGDFVTGG